MKPGCPCQPCLWTGWGRQNPDRGRARSAAPAARGSSHGAAFWRFAVQVISTVLSVSTVGLALQASLGSMVRRGPPISKLSAGLLMAVITTIKQTIPCWSPPATNLALSHSVAAVQTQRHLPFLQAQQILFGALVPHYQQSPVSTPLAASRDHLY